VQEEIQRQLLGSRYSIVEDSKALAGMTPAQIQEILASGTYQDLVAALGKHADVAVLGEVSTAERSNSLQMYPGTDGGDVTPIARPACPGMSTSR
jgi:hypothetical protein